MDNLTKEKAYIKKVLQRVFSWKDKINTVPGNFHLSLWPNINTIFP